ncbi:amidohydrolase family protein [candidate division KSB1 bacterium]|nr:amidohydrolase family protein [candidate division KSB1 bacterium]
MRTCQYIYCRNSFDGSLAVCPVCGYPVDDSNVNTLDFALKNAPKLPVESVIDMHQIIPNREGMFDAQIQMMHGIGVEKALLQSVPTKVTSIWSNRQLLEIQKAHPEQFIISHFMDPRHPLARKRLRQYRERGVRFIKLLPCLGYQPDDKRWDRFFKTMESFGLIAMIHTGFITARHKDEERRAGVFLHSKYGRPIFFDILARKYPGIQFILCHMGGSIWTREAVEMVNQHENVWGDVSGSGLQALKRIVREDINVDWSKLFWGNDSSPFMYPYNLNLLIHYLSEIKKPDLPRQLLHNNSYQFISKHIT